MYPNIKKSLAILSIALSSTVFALPTQAEIIQGGGVVINEVVYLVTDGPDPALNDGIFPPVLGLAGEYQVTNNSDQSIFAFAISNNYAETTPYAQSATASDGEPILWGATIVDATSWDNTTVFDAGYNTVALNTFGSFTDFFNSNDKVFLYSLGEVGLINPGASVTGAFLFEPALLASSGVVFGSNGGVNTAITVSAVPVPAAVWLFGSGLIGLVGIARRKTAA